MNIKKQAVAVAVQTGIPVLLWGTPGTGKTSFINSLGKQLGLPVETVIASIREPSDFSGLPVLVDGEVKMAPPAWARRLKEAGKGILFLDEISTAPPAVQAALLRVVLDRVVGELELPSGVSIIAAANPPEQAAGGWDLSAPLANRFCHIDWNISPQEWAEGFATGFKEEKIPVLPGNWKEKLSMTKSLISAFIHARPQLLLQMPKEESQIGKAWPSPRSWEMAAYLYTAAEAANTPDDVKTVLISGSVGEGAALEFISWVKDLDLPDPEDILAVPEKFVLPQRGDKAYAVLSAVAHAVVEKSTKQRWLAAWKIIHAAVDQGGKDVAAAAVKTLIQARRPDYPIPTEDVRAFIPLLTAAGIKI
ncbi:MoxR-like ATPase [Thermoanaerobacter thermohydrosulfuricus]|uniref:MoxR-like ATPase n=1 Tax=Thermoanaerobacter thermohydrosulfuricus TaxID=1516 RepID=A0A1G7LSP5_THETY|nr:MoxR family ATPase [Thermoanaerobacter thermohydrosulfuricus]SDF52374.1 MoxR-like ATPase [Thermoanaerobacter thermohydrosulfuricus]